MPSIYDVSAVRRDESRNSYEKITHLCGPSFDGSLWEISQQEAIEGIKCGRFEFYVNRHDGSRAKIVVARGPYGMYLKSNTDKLEPETLLSLPDHNGD